MLGGMLGIFLVVSLFPLASSQPSSARPDRLKWSVIETPSGKDNVVVTPSEINAFVISANKTSGANETFYAIDIPNKKIYKSTDGGVSWKNKTTAKLEDAGAKLPAWDIAVAPDDPDLVAVVTNNRTAVYTSEDGGDKWKNTTDFNLNNKRISDIAISLEYEEEEGETYRDIAIGTRDPASPTNGDVWTIRWNDRFVSWSDQKLKADVTTVLFSPGYTNDSMLFAIASPTNNVSWPDGTYLCSGQRYTAYETHDATDWKTFTEIGANVGSSPTKNEIIFSDLALPSDQNYNPNSKYWLAYASYYSNTTYDDVYLIEVENNKGMAYRLNATRGTGAGIASIDYIVSKDMLTAGEVLAKAKSANALIHNCTNPEAGTPEIPKWKTPTKPPTGGAGSGRANAVVRWSTTGILYCATSTNTVTTAAEWADTTLAGPWRGNLVNQSSDESAFSRSKDTSATWNQLSLIDTNMTYLEDYASSADNSVLYLASINERTGFDSLWHTEETGTELLTEVWERVLCFKSTGNIILRPTPEWKNKEQIYFAVPGTFNVQYSEDNGQTWTPLLRGPDVTDIAVVSDELLYILDNYFLNKCTRNGKKWEWEKDIDTGLKSGSAVIAYDKDNIFVSDDRTGRIAYSSDGGETFDLTTPLPQFQFGNKMHFTTDEEFSDNKFIYAASDKSLSDVYRWTIGGARAWKAMNVPRPTDTTKFCGLLHKGGVLYGAFQLQDGIARLLTPHLENIRPTDWDTLPSVADITTIKLGSLKATVKENVEIWAIDNRTYFKGDVSRYDDKGYNTEGRLWTYTDAFSLQTPWASSPPPPATDSIPCDVCTCEAVQFCFQWRMLPSTEKYELWIALDEDFTAIVHTEENITPDDQYSPTWCPDSDSFRFVCGETYYWKVRSCESDEGDRIHSRWSPPLRFKVKECSAEEGEVYLAPLLLTPPLGSKDIARSPTFTWKGFQSTTEYELILAKDAALTDVILQEKLPTTHYQYERQLDWGATYYWQVRATEPVSSNPSVGVFTVIRQGQPAQTPSTPSWVWVIIGIITFLDVLVITFCLRRR